jgi:cation diffusion facilitator family transporter
LHAYAGVASDRRLTVYAAIAANVAIALTKFIAAAITSSSAMLSEGIHSAVDTGDGLFLALGLALSRRPPTKRHPYGHGLEVYFWSMVVAMSIFGIGGGMSIWEGVVHIEDPRPIDNLAWLYAVLAIAFAFEGASFLVARRGFQEMRGQRGRWEEIVTGKDPTRWIVVLEDGAALIGILVAATGVTLARWLSVPQLDGVASIVIGVMLVAVAIVLGRETWSLLTGESADLRLVESIQKIAAAQPEVIAAQPPRTMHFGPDRVHVDLDLAVDPQRSAAEIIEATRRIEQEVNRVHPEVQRVSLRFPVTRTP